MTLGTGSYHFKHHRKHKHNLAPQQRSNTERAIQHSALVRAKNQTLKASIWRRDDTDMRFLAVRPDLFDTPIPGLGGGSTDRFLLPTGEPLSPKTREAIFTPVSIPLSPSGPLDQAMPVLNHDPQPSHCVYPFPMTPLPPSPSTTSSTTSCPNRYERRRSGLSAEDTPKTPVSTSPSHSSAADSHRGQRSALLHMRGGPSPLNRHVDRARRGPGGGWLQSPADGGHPHVGQTTPHRRSLSQLRSPSTNPHDNVGAAQASEHPPSTLLTTAHAGNGQVARNAQPLQDSDYRSPDVLDLVMEDGVFAEENDGAAPDKDPYHRLSALEDQVELQSKKLDSTNTKLDLLCDLIQHLKGSESGSGVESSSSPHIVPHQSPPTLATNCSEGPTSQDPAPPLLVLGSRSDGRANQPQLQAQTNVLSRRRTRADLQIERAIDAHWKTLMSTYQLPERGVVKGYKLENGKACSATTFQPDHRENVKSPWNTSVVEVFVDSLFSSNHPHIPTPPTPEMQATVLRLAFSQLRSWREKQRLTAEEEQAKLRKKRRYERRRQSYFRRVNVASLHTDTRRHLEMLSYLGPDGMSSDESDHEKANGIAQYRIRPKSWRHPDLVRCVRVFDALHRRDRFHEDDDDKAANTPKPSHPIRLTAGPGAPTHLRVEGGSNSTRKPKKGLPDCLYNPDLLKRPEGERLLAIRSEPYDFSHTASIIKMAQSKNGDASGLGPFPEM